MIRLFLAVLLVLPVAALVRADEDNAYGSLVGMADSASTDKGPEAGEIPSDLAPTGRRTESEPPADQTGPAEPAVARVEEKKIVSAGPAPSRARKENNAAAVAVPVAPAARVWTRLFASLLPPMTRVASFDIEVSTTILRARPAPVRAVTPASAAGAAQGLLELVATATAPSVR